VTAYGGGVSRNALRVRFDAENSVSGFFRFFRLFEAPSHVKVAV